MCFEMLSSGGTGSTCDAGQSEQLLNLFVVVQLLFLLLQFDRLSLLPLFLQRFLTERATGDDEFPPFQIQILCG